jgi:hypothetical protein
MAQLRLVLMVRRWPMRKVRLAERPFQETSCAIVTPYRRAML